MFCKKSSKDDVVLGAGVVPVYLNVYDLSSINDYTYWAGLGIYHSGVEVYGIEYAFGAHESPKSGIFKGEPKRSEMFKFKKSILIGKTNMRYSEVRRLMKKLGAEYRGNAYDLITKNCNHFCNDVCIKLTGNPIPSWINRLARIGLMLNCVLPETLKSIELRDHTIKEKQMQCEGKKQASTCDSNNVYETSNISLSLLTKDSS